MTNVAPWEPALQLLLRDWLQPGMRFVDGGANLGALSLTAAEIVGPRGEVVAIEPNPLLWPLLRDNLARVAAVTSVEPFALWAHDDVTLPLALDTTQAHAGGSSVVRIWPGMQTVYVTTVRLDSLLRPWMDRRATVLKLDVEGAEDQALQGAAVLLEKVQPVILLEYSLPCPGADPLARLLAMGYTAFSANTYRPVIPEKAGVLPVGAHLDLLCLPPGVASPYATSRFSLPLTPPRVSSGTERIYEVPFPAGRTALVIRAEPFIEPTPATLALRDGRRVLVEYTAPPAWLLGEACVPVVELAEARTLVLTLPATVVLTGLTQIRVLRA